MSDQTSTAIPERDDQAVTEWPTREQFESEWLGRAGLTYRRGGPGDRRYPTTKTYEDCTVLEVIWPGSTIQNDDGEWIAFRFRFSYRAADGKRRQITTAGMPSNIPASRSDR